VPAMDYAGAVATFYSPRPAGTPLPEAVSSGGPARRLRDACEPVAMHAVWNRHTIDRLADLGLDFLTGYVGGRAASLGEPSPPVVAAAFAWFEPAMLAGLYAAARAAAPRDRLLAVRDSATTASLAEVLAGDDPAGTADLLADAAEGADGTGRPLFSGLRGRGRPADPVQRLWWACDLIREHRGDSHVAVANAAGLGPIEMNVLTECWIGMPLLSYTATRGWPEAAMRAAVDGLEARGWLRDGTLTDAGRAARAGLEDRTDAAEQTIVAALGGRLDEVCARLDDWGARCITAGAFPADILKRAAG
jgi:helix-turn-helix protein